MQHEIETYEHITSEDYYDLNEEKVSKIKTFIKRSVILALSIATTGFIIYASAFLTVGNL